MKEFYGEGLANHTSLESCGNCSNAMAVSGQEAVWIGDPGLYGYLKPHSPARCWYGEKRRHSQVDPGVGPQQLIDMEQIIADFGLWNRPILSFLGAKMQFLQKKYGESKKTFDSGIHLHTAVKQSKKRFNEVNNPSMP